MTRYKINRTFNRLAFMSVVIALLLVSCGSGQHPPTANQPTAVTSLTAGAALKHMPQGSVLLIWTPNDQTLNVNVRLYGLSPNSTHPVAIHSGSCPKQGPVLYPLQNMVADAHGVADTTTQIKNVKNGIPASGWYVNVHNGPRLSPAIQFLSIVCGNITNPAPTTTSLEQINVPMISAPGSSYSERRGWFSPSPAFKEHTDGHAHAQRSGSQERACCPYSCRKLPEPGGSGLPTKRGKSGCFRKCDRDNDHSECQNDPSQRMVYQYP